MTASDRYPSREALATRPPPEMTAEQEVDATALDRPRFVVEQDLGVPHTREQPIDDTPLQRREEPELPSFEAMPERLFRRSTLLWVALLVAAFAGVAGCFFGAWLAGT